MNYDLLVNSLPNIFCKLRVHIFDSKHVGPTNFTAVIDPNKPYKNIIRSYLPYF